MFLGEALFAVREVICESETGLSHQASAGRFRTPTENPRNFVRAAVLLVDRGQRLPRSSSELSTYFSDAPTDQSQDVLEIDSGDGPGLALSEHDPCVVGGTVTLDDVSFTAKIAMHSGGDVISPHRCVVLFDTGSPQTFIRRTR